MTGSAGFVTNAAGRMMTPGYVDIHAHGSGGVPSMMVCKAYAWLAQVI